MIPVLEVKNISKIYGKECPHCLDPENAGGSICPFCHSVAACRDVSFSLYEDEVLGIVGESGSGKSTLLKILNFDEEPTRGVMEIGRGNPGKFGIKGINLDFIENANLLTLNPYRKRLLRNHLMGMVYQNPHLGLKMHISSGGNIGERLLMAGWRNIGSIRSRAMELLIKTEVPPERMDEAPSKFSGGMQQRVQIAKALSNNPIILYLDEPTTGLDLSVQARVLDLVKKLQKELKLAMIVVSHDLGIIRHLTSRTIVMKNGRVVESGLTDQVLEDPQNAYTQLLVHSNL
ncbi:MAG: ATP-binding cassette domain-containing protein [Brevinematales bacterium]|jgi:putative phosphonate transport system ATP-binding protein